MLGLHEYRIRLHPEVAVTITVNVAQSEEEAEKQKQLGQAIIPSESGEGDENEGADSFSVAELLDEVPTSDTAEDDTSEQLIEIIPTDEPNT
jgi:large subunit ribosomal protein L9